MNLNLNQIFNRSEFIEWINDFLPNFNLNIQKVDVPKGFKGATSIETLGESELGVRVFIIETDNDPSKRRVGWATDSFSVLKNSGSSNALMVYFSQETSQWRLSLLTSSPVWGDGKVILKLSNPKRQSYVLGPKAKVKTPQQFLINKGRITNLDDLKTRFSLEVVNKEFYKEISKLFTELVGGTVSVGKKKIVFEPLIKLPSTQDGSATSLEFAVRLIGRIIFCWFLREKHSASGNSLMPKDLVSLESVIKTTDYYHRILEPIFFEVLNKPQKSRIEPFDDKLFSEIPYLNGGLFSPQKDSDFYERARNDLQSKFHNTLIIPDKWIKSFFEVLETYNFTIDENTSFDEELSIDPEMLGRIFENLLAEINPETGESARKSTGSYYTPRIIVDYMVDESLCLYLKEKTGIEEKKLKSLISYDLEDDLPLNDEDKDKIIKYLGEIKILDPACGSGAFPIGALQKIVFILQQIDSDGSIWKKQQLSAADFEFRHIIEEKFSNNEINYLRKLAIIRKSIFGVDIQPIATEISRLRCFLTLTVEQKIDDTKENRGIQPLPNLDFKFVIANSLIGLPKNDQMTLFEDKSGIDQLRNLRNRFFTATKEERYEIKDEFKEVQKGMLSKMIDLKVSGDLTRKLSEWNPFSHNKCDWFDPEWMFGITDGFDIVIANPPYQEVEKNEHWSKFYHDVLKGHYDLYVFFYKIGVDLLSKNGILTFITPHTFLSYSQFENLRKFLLRNIKIIECTSKLSSIFENAVVDNSIFIAQKTANIILSKFSKMCVENSIVREVDYISMPFENISSETFEYEVIKAKQDLLMIKTETISLDEVVDSSQGITVYAKVQGEKINYIFNNPGDNFKKITRGKEISKYRLNWAGDYIKYGNWLWCRRKSIFFEKPKIFLRQTSDSIIATYVEEPFYCLDSVHSLIQKTQEYSLFFILGLLNSKLISYVYKKITAESNKVFAQVKLTKLRRLPIPKVSNENKSDFEYIHNLVSNFYNVGGDLITIQEKIDRKVYRLYGLNDEEIEIVEKST